MQFKKAFSTDYGLAPGRIRTLASFRTSPNVSIALPVSLKVPSRISPEAHRQDIEPLKYTAYKKGGLAGIRTRDLPAYSDDGYAEAGALTTRPQERSGSPVVKELDSIS